MRSILSIALWQDTLLWVGIIIILAYFPLKRGEGAIIARQLLSNLKKS